MAVRLFGTRGRGRWWRPPMTSVLLRQVYFTGVESLSLIILIAIAVGGIIVHQMHYQFGQAGHDTLRLLSLLTLNELSPMLTALILIARSSSAMASELAAMRVHGEIRVLRRLGLSVRDYLLVPRVVGMVLASFVLSLYFSAATLLAAALAVGGLNGPHELALLGDSLPWTAVGQGVLKSLLFGLAIAITSCRAGMTGGLAMTDIPKAASRAVINCLLAVFAVDLAVLVL